MGVEAFEEAHTKHHYNRGVASQFRAFSGWIYRCACEGVFELHQGDRCETREQCLGRKAAIQHGVRRIFK